MPGPSWAAQEKEEAGPGERKESVLAPRFTTETEVGCSGGSSAKLTCHGRNDNMTTQQQDKRHDNATTRPHDNALQCRLMEPESDQYRPFQLMLWCSCSCLTVLYWLCGGSGLLLALHTSSEV